MNIYGLYQFFLHPGSLVNANNFTFAECWEVNSVSESEKITHSHSWLTQLGAKLPLFHNFAEMVSTC